MTLYIHLSLGRTISRDNGDFDAIIYLVFLVFNFCCWMIENSF